MKYFEIEMDWSTPEPQPVVRWIEAVKKDEKPKEGSDGDLRQSDVPASDE